jgi:hypothetical protein
MSYEQLMATPNPEEGNGFYASSGEILSTSLHFCCSWLGMSSASSRHITGTLLVRGGAEDYVESCNWLHHRILTDKQTLLCNRGKKVGDEWANIGGGQHSPASLGLCQRKRSYPARLSSWQPAFLMETAFFCKLNIYFSFRNLSVTFREILLLSNVQ